MLGLEQKIDHIVNNPGLFVIQLMIIILAISLHEFGHAIMATICGDPTPRYDGRVTLNPMAHLDPIGTLAIVFMGFGWGKPVMVQPANFRNKRWDDIKVSAAGPAMNLVQALIFGFALRVALQTGAISWDSISLEILGFAFTINVVLLVFNLIPIGPLDGSHILKGLLPLRAAYEYEQFNRSWGMLLLIGLLITGGSAYFIRPVEAALVRMIGLA